MAFLWTAKKLPFCHLRFTFEKVSEGSPTSKAPLQSKKWPYNSKESFMKFLVIRLSVQNVFCPQSELIQKKITEEKTCCLDWPTLKFNQTLLLYQLFSRNVQLLLNNTDSAAEQWLLLSMQSGTCNPGKLSRAPCGCECLSGTLERSVEGTGNYLCQRWPTPYGNNRLLCVLSPLQWIILRNMIKESTEWNTLM